MPARIGTVADDTVDEFRDTVDDAAGRHDGAKMCLGDFRVFCLQKWNGEGEILTYEVEHGVAYHGAYDDPPLPILE